MPPSDDPTEEGTVAVAAEGLYLANLLLIPGIAFVALLLLWQRHRQAGSALAKAHLAQTMSASIWAGVLLIGANALILLLGGYHGPYVWVIVITYFTVCHAVLVMFGAFGLSKAMAGQCWRFPLVGRPLPAGCRS